MKIYKIESEEYPISIKSEVERIGIKVPPTESVSTDILLHDWLIDKLKGKKPEVIFIPVSIGMYQSNFWGVNLAMHLRLTKELEELCFCPIVFYSYLPLEIVAKISQYSHILFAEGSSFFRVGLDDPEQFISNRKFEHLSHDEHLALMQNIKIEVPKSFFDDNHSIANIWGAYLLNKVAGANVNLRNDYEKNLYFKWVSSKVQKIEFDSTESDTFSPFLAGKKLALVDDEYGKGWKDILSIIVERYGGELLCYETFKDIDKKGLIKGVEQFAKSNSDVDIFLVDLRIFEDDHQPEKKSNQLTGIDLIKSIKSVNRGNQVVVFTASNKIWTLDEARDKGADGYYIKESPNLFFMDRALENYSKFIADLERLSLRAEYLKPLWENNLWIQNSLAFNPYSPLKLPASQINKDLIKAEYSHFFSIINGAMDLNNPNQEDLRYCVIVLQKILEIFKDEYVDEAISKPPVKDKKGTPKVFKNKIPINWYKKDELSYRSVEFSKCKEDDYAEYKSIANLIRAIDYQLFSGSNYQLHVKIGNLITTRNGLIHHSRSYNIVFSDLIDWQKQVVELLKKAPKFKW